MTKHLRFGVPLFGSTDLYKRIKWTEWILSVWHSVTVWLWQTLADSKLLAKQNWENLY